MPAQTPAFLTPTPALRHAERQRPDAVVVLRQRWENLLFVHWRWDPALVQARLPAGLRVDTYHGGAWVGLALMFLRNVRANLGPALPWVSDFLEVDVRTYVHDARGHPGVYCFSRDCDQPLVVEATRRLLRLNTEHASLKAAKAGDGFVEFQAQRRGAEARDDFRYRASGDARAAVPGSLEEFLVDRYRLFTVFPGGEPWSSRLHHPACGLRTAEAILTDPSLLRLAGFEPHGRAPDHICVADPLEVEVFLPEPNGMDSDT